MISRDNLYDMTSAFIVIRHDVKSELNDEILLETKAKLKNQEMDKYIYEILVTICDEMIRVFDEKKFEQLYDLADCVHSLPEIIANNHLTIPDRYWKIYVDPYRKKWDKEFLLKEEKAMRKKKVRWFCIVAILMVIAILAVLVLQHYNIIPSIPRKAAEFNIELITSQVDYNNNGIDDYTDIMLGAREDAKNHPTYKSAYYDGGYPPDNEGVCTDVVWRAFKNAGYSLKDMVDADIIIRLEDYHNVEKPDPNIDFRRVKNLKVFFDEYAQILTTDIDDYEQWQPGDIVIFGDNTHIGIVSDVRNSKGQPYIIHNSGQFLREEDALKFWTPTAHYRFDASKVPDEVLKGWN